MDLRSTDTDLSSFVRPQKCCSCMVSNIFKTLIICVVIFDVFSCAVLAYILGVFFFYQHGEHFR